MGRANQLMLLESVVRAGVITGTTFTVSRYIPKPLKWFAVFLVALNLRVFPVAWHSESVGLSFPSIRFAYCQTDLCPPPPPQNIQSVFYTHGSAWFGHIGLFGNGVESLDLINI